MKKVTKSFVAMLALVSMLTQNAYGVYAAATAPEPITVENGYAEEQMQDIQVATEEVSESESEEIITEPAVLEDSTSEYVATEEDAVEETTTSDINYDDQIMLIDDISETEAVPEEVDIPDEIEVYDNQISGSGLSELEVFIDTEKLEVGDSFRIIFIGSENAAYDTRLNDNLDTTSQGVYRFTGLNNEGFNIRAASDDNVKFEFLSEDGRPVIRAISVESDIDKLLFAKTIEDENGKPITAIRGEGYKKLSIKLNSDKLIDDAEYTLYVDTEASVEINGEVTDHISGTKFLESVELSNLNKKQFIVYVTGNEGFEVDSDASIIDVSEGKAELSLESVATKTVYEFEDANVYVRAVLEKADAIPDDAFFSVELVNDASEYIDAMNEGTDEEKYTEDNTLIYDIGFYTDETKSEEIEPEKGSVSVSIKFKKDQINNELAADTEVEDVEITHFEEKGNDIEAVVVESTTSSDNTEVEFSLDSFSKIAVYANGGIIAEPGKSVSCESVLGDAYYYGIVGNYVHIDGHLESNFAAGELAGGANIASPKNEGGAGVNYIGSYTGSHFFIDPNGNTKGSIRIYTTQEAVNRFGNEMADRIRSGKVTIDYTKSSDDIKSFVSKMVDNVRVNSNSMAEEENAIKYSSIKDNKSNDGFIDLTGCKAGTYYINYEAGEWKKAGSSFKYKINANQNLVLNIPDKEVGFSQYELIVDGKRYCPQGGSNEEILFEKLIFNCPNATKATTNTPVTGTFLLPSAGFYNNSVAAGFVVADRIEKIGDAEWHCISKNIPVIEDDKTELEIPVLKHFVDMSGNEVSDDKWPAKGFKFTISKYPCNDPGDSNDGNVEKNINNIPDINGTNTVTIYGNTKDHTAVFGKLTFTGADVYNDSRSHVSGSFPGRDVRYRAFMYKIVEEDTGESGVIYDNVDPLYIKVFVNSERIKLGDNSYKYYVWTEVKTARTVREYQCLPKLPEFTNRYYEDVNVVLHGKKTVNNSETGVPDKKFTFELYSYDRDNKWGGWVTSVTNDGSAFSFPEMKLDFAKATGYNTGKPYAQDKTATEAYFYYKIVEKNDCAPYTYDKAGYIAKITLKKVNGGFDKTVQYFRFDDASEINCKEYAQQDKDNPAAGVTKTVDMKFNNTYDATGSVELYAKKVLSNAVLKKDDFSFSLYRRENGTDTKLQTVKNDEYGNVSFSPLEYKLSDVKKSFTYVIKEDEGNIPGITYDTHEEVVTVTVEDKGDGTLVIAADKAMANSPVQFSNVYNADGGIVFSAVKTFSTGAKMPADKSFTFVLKENGKVIDRQSVTGAGCVSFNTINYALSDVGAHTYTIEEERPEGATEDNDYTYQGVVYDSTVHTIKVDVDDAGNGKLSTSVNGVESAALSVSFTNDYKINDTDISVNGNKVLKGMALNEGMFRFNLEAGDDTTKAAIETGTVVLPGTVSVNNNADGSFAFGNIVFKAEGDYSFKVTEDSTDRIDGIQYSTDVYIINVNVKDDNNGNLVAKKTILVENGGEVGEIKFINYFAENGVVIEANKSLTGRTLEDNQFNFELRDNDGTLLQTANNDAAGHITFKKINYKLSDLGNADSKDYVYTINEVTPDEDGRGYAYDRTVKTVNVRVSKAINEDGSIGLNAEASYVNNDNTFVNTYSATGKVQFGGNKMIVGRRFKTEDNAKFQAVLKNSEGKVIDTQDIIKNLSILNDRGGSFMFGELEYTEPGNYTYTVEETGSAVNVTNDTVVYKVVVSVIDNGDGTLSATPVFTRGNTTANEIVFNNVYDADGKAVITALKTIDFGTIQNKQFTFELKDETGNVIDAKANDKSGAINFKPLEYSLKDLGDQDEKVFKYTISEKNAGQKIDGFTYSSDVYEVEVTVKNVGGENLTTSVVYKKAGELVETAVFNNKYDASGKVQLFVKKILNGRAMTDGQFKFELRDENGDIITTMPVPAAAAGAEAIVKFPEWTFTQEDLKADALTHPIDGGKFARYYTIREVIPANAESGYTYDERVYNVVVTLKDNGDGTITTDWSAYESGKTPEKPSVWDKIVEFFTGKNAGQNVEFINDYVAEGQIAFKAHKTVTGAVLEDGEFAFNLSGNAEDGSDINQTLTNDADGNVSFNTITYTKPGTYTYTIKEVVPSDDNKKAGYTYDATEHTALVDVSDDGTGVLKVVATIDGKKYESAEALKDSGEKYGLCSTDAVEFINSYKADDTAITIGGTKTLTGKVLTENEFSFNMVSADSNTKTYSETVTNSADGSFSFPAITYTFDDMKNADGTYAESKDFAYEITEVKGTEEGITYSEETFNLVVRVTNANGKLSTALLVNKLDKSASPLEAVSFTNAYNVNGETSLQVKKVVRGKENSKYIHDKFTFELLDADADDNVIATREIEANQTAVFEGLDELRYDLSRLDKNADGSYSKTFTYKMKERPGAIHGYTYSDIIYLIKVDVVSSPDGQMTITKTITAKDGISVAEPMVFENPYEANGEIVINGTKTFASTNELAKGDFEFVLKENDIEIARVKNGYSKSVSGENEADSEAAISADNFEFRLGYTQEDIGEHIYTVSELIPDEKNSKIVYDAHVANVKVSVNDNGDGTLSCVKSTDSDAVSFVNYEVADDEVQFTAKKNLTGMALNDDMFTFTLEDEKGNVIQSVKNKGEDIVFAPIPYTLASLEGNTEKQFTYKVKEVAGNNKGIKYSNEVYTATVTVSYENGKLTVAKEIKNSEGVTVSSSGNDGMIFNNIYESSAKVKLGGNKELVGFDKRDEANKGTYKFVLYDESGKAKDFKEVTGKGEFEFDEITFTQDDYLNDADHEFHYTVKEVVDNEQKNVSYDETVYHVTVMLGYNADGTLNAEVSTTEGVDATKHGLTFTNIYKAENSITFRGVKSVEGTTLKTYRFALYEGDDTKPLQTVENNGATITFVPIKYSQEDIGEHVYYIEEVAGAQTEGMTYDATVYKIVVEVADKADGTLEVSRKTYKAANDSADYVEISSETGYKVNFVNHYSAKGETSLSGKKILENRKIKDTDEFTFVLKDADGSVVDRVQCGTDGSFEFDGDYFKFDQEVLKNSSGSYDESITKYYTVEEVKGDVAGITYSDTVYAIAVKITDKNNGTLDVKTDVKKTDASVKTGFAGLLESIKNTIAGSNDKLEFTNVYNASGQWDPEGLKELVGRDLKDGEFTFKISEVDLNNKTVGDHEFTVVNDGNNIKFSSDTVVSKKGDYFLKYDIRDLDPDTLVRHYIYNFSEVKQDTVKGVKYDDTLYTIKVAVSDAGDGTLNVDADKDEILKKITEKIKNSNIEDKEIDKNAVFLFYNEYAAEGRLDLIGTKDFDGPEALADEFRFSIKETTPDKQSAEITVGSTLDEKGNRIVSFPGDLDILNYKYAPSEKIDDRGIHTYEIREVIPDDSLKAPGVKYDERVYTVTVDVTDNGEGSLIPTVTGITHVLNGGAYEPYDFFAGGEENKADYFSFDNKYEAKGELVFNGMKFLKQYEDSKNYLTGDVLKNFEFTLYRIDATKDTLVDHANPIESGSYILGTDESGNIVDDLKFTQKDIGKEFLYQIKETKREGDGVVYDNAVYDVKVTVEGPAAGSDKLRLTVVATDQNGNIVNVKLDNDEYLYSASSFDFKNYKPEYVVISGEKHWIGGPSDGSRPSEVTVNLYASNVGVGQQIINSAVAKAPDWKYRFDSHDNGKKLPAYTTDGQKITYRVEEVPVPGYLSEIVEVVENKVFDIYNTYGELLIRKVDSLTGATLEGAELVILDASGNEVDRWTSGTSAHAVDISKVEFDKTYTLREVSAPTGYKLAADQEFTFKKGETTIVTMRDDRIVGSVRLRKLDAETREALEGAEFALYREDGTRIYASGVAGSYRYSESSSNGRFEVNSSGEIEITNLPYGSYYFTETVAPAGYIRSTERFAFSVLEDGAVAEVVALNAKERGSVRLRKTNADGTVSLAGAVFELYAKTPTTAASAIASTIYSGAYYRVGTYTTDASGVIEVTDLPWDDYYFVEVEAPAGYEVNRDVNGDPVAYTFTIGATGSAVVAYDLGRITNSTTPPDTPPTPPTPPRRGGEVRGERRPTDSGRRSGGVLAGVLGVRAAPKAGVLGERLGPVTGDAFNIFLWTLLLLASMGSILAVAIANIRRKKRSR